jgi:hypothetical protein
VTERRSRRQVSVRRRPWLAVTVGLLGLGAAVAVPLLAVEATQTLSDSTVGEIEAPLRIDRLPDTPAALVAAVDENDQVASLTVFAGSPSGQGGTIIVVPAGTAVGEAGVATKVRLASLYGPGDDGRAALSGGVEEMLGITLNDTLVVDEAGLAALLAPYGPFDAELPSAVSDSERNGEAEVVLDAGERQLSVEEAARVLTAVPVNESEIVRLPDVTAVWQAVADAVGDGVAASGVSGERTTDAPSLVRHVFAGPVRVRALGASPVLDLAANPDEVDLLEVDGIEALLLVGRVLPGAASPVSSGLRIKLVDATDRRGALEDAVLLLTYFGVAVVWIDDAPAQPATVVHYRSADDVAVFRELENVFGPVQLEPADRPVEGVDATITLGQNFPEFPADGGPITVDTTVAASPATFSLEPEDTVDAGDGGDDEDGDDG